MGNSAYFCRDINHIKKTNYIIHNMSTKLKSLLQQLLLSPRRFPVELALGIALVYLGNQKEEEKKKNEAASTSKPKLTPIIENKPVQVTEPIRQKTYWENYKDTNPSKAKEIEELLRIDMSKLSNRDAREKI